MNTRQSEEVVPMTRGNSNCLESGPHTVKRKNRETGSELRRHRYQIFPPEDAEDSLGGAPEAVVIEPARMRRASSRPGSYDASGSTAGTVLKTSGRGSGLVKPAWLGITTCGSVVASITASSGT